MFRSGRGGRKFGRGRFGGQWNEAEREEWLRFMRERFGQTMGQHWFFQGRRFHGGRFGEWGPYRANPILSQLLSKGGGILPIYVLHLLAEKPRYGNDLMKALETRTEGAWSANPGAIYPLLNAMEEAGLVEGSWEDPVKRSRRFYRLTERGQEELATLKKAMFPLLQAAADILQKLMDDLYGANGAPEEEAE